MYDDAGGPSTSVIGWSVRPSRMAPGRPPGAPLILAEGLAQRVGSLGRAADTLGDDRHRSHPVVLGTERPVTGPTHAVRDRRFRLR